MMDRCESKYLRDLDLELRSNAQMGLNRKRAASNTIRSLYGRIRVTWQWQGFKIVLEKDVSRWIKEIQVFGLIISPTRFSFDGV